jgi:hypothetical protein
MRKRRTEIIVETHELLTVRVFQRLRPAWCSDCGEESRMLTPDEAAGICRVSTRHIYCWVEAQKIHFKETAGGALLVCLSSCLAGANEVADGTV